MTFLPLYSKANFFLIFPFFFTFLTMSGWIPSRSVIYSLTESTLLLNTYWWFCCGDGSCYLSAICITFHIFSCFFTIAHNSLIFPMCSLFPLMLFIMLIKNVFLSRPLNSVSPCIFIMFVFYAFFYFITIIFSYILPFLVIISH